MGALLMKIDGIASFLPSFSLPLARMLPKLWLLGVKFLRWAAWSRFALNCNTQEARANFSIGNQPASRLQSKAADANNAMQGNAKQRRNYSTKLALH